VTVLRFNEGLRRQAGAHGVEVVDLYEASQREVPRHPELISVDGYHPSLIDRLRIAWVGVRIGVIRIAHPEPVSPL